MGKDIGGKVTVIRDFWRCLSRMVVACVAVFLFTNAAVAACSSNQIDVLGDGTQCETVKFSVTTTSDATSLEWKMSAQGTFWVDCGTGGTLSGTGVSGKTITRSDTNEASYTCSWNSAGARTVKFGGETPTAYGGSSVISFSTTTKTKVASISGSLASLFPQVSGLSATYMFMDTFNGCSSLTSLPEQLFNGITGGGQGMFMRTFKDCTGLTTSGIPSNLFSTVTNTAYYLFDSTFYGCTGLTSMPEGLFYSISSGAMYLFRDVFHDCTNMAGFIPPTTFRSMGTSRYQWSGSFTNTQLVKLCPVGHGQYYTGNEGFNMDYSNWKDGYVSCAPCDAGTYKSTVGNEACTSCDVGTYNPNTGSTSSSACIACGVGTYNSYTGAQQCYNCNGGTYNPNTGSTSSSACIACDVGTYSSSGSSSCTPCTNKPAHSTYTGSSWSNNCAWTCDSGYIKIDSSCESPKFSVTTTSDATSLSWTMSARGPFVADCGDGGTLTQNTSSYGTISGNTITRTSTSETTYTCTWGSAGAHTVRFGGVATGYNTGTTMSSISFNAGTNDKIASIDGSLGAMFPVINGDVPRFYSTFYGTGITSIPAGLFSGINTSSATNTSFMFYTTFYNTRITSIPAGLFSTINTSSATDTSYMFEYTFYNTAIESIPAGLFSTINTSSATNTSHMFGYTFYNTPITSIPAGLFSTINTSSATDTSWMFNSTFYITAIESIPAGLFSGIDTSSATNTSYMFYRTFYNCTSLTGYIPPTAFPNTIVPGSSSSGSMWYQTFRDTNLDTSCPAGTGEYNTGFQNDWGYSNRNTTTSGTHRVSCEPCGTLPANATWITGTCNWACDGGYYSANGTSCTAVETGYYSPAGDNTRTACTNGPTNSSYSGSGGATDSCPWACDGGYYSANGTSCTTVETGYYSPAGTNTRTACTNGPAHSSYTGSGGATNSCSWECSANYFADNGTCVACSSVGDGSYTNSAAGATINTQCYKACTTSTANIAHATAITGNDYYGVGRDTCEPTACESGYHVKSINLADSDLGLIYLRSYNNEGYISNNGARSSNQNTYELTENGTFGTTYDVYGVTKITKGRAQCSTQIGTGAWNGAMSYNEVTTSATLPDSTGQYCYCALDEYIPDGGAPMSVSGPWVFKYQFDGYQYGSGNCVDGCARVCAQTSNTDQNGRDIMFVYKYLLTATSVTCDANSYTITYSAGTGTGANQTQSVTYNAAFTTKPANTFTMANATFAGWSPSAGSYTAANTEYTYTQTDNITLTAQWTCDAGYYLSGGACVDAGVGYYSPAGDNARYSCTNAPANATYTAGSATSSCPWACDGGYYSADSTSCTAVETGYYSPAGSNTRTACTNGPTNSSYSGSGGATNSCDWTCDAGYYYDNGTCTACAAGTYKAAAGNATSCTTPDEGYYVATTSATSQTRCPTGYRSGSDGGRDEITDCYVTANATCTQNECSNPDTTGCSGYTCAASCSCAGTTTYKQYSNAAGTGNGTASGTTTESCTKAVASLTAKANYYVDGTTSCPACSSVGDGSYTLSAGGVINSNSCYKNITRGCTQNTCSCPGNSTCTCSSCSCDGTTYIQYANGTNFGTTTNETCNQTVATYTCDAGYYYDNGTCTACAAGTYKASSGNTACSTPDDGYYVATTGATAQTQCPTGYRSGSDGGRDEITDCYVTANATCTQNECSNPDTTGCSGYTCAASCSCAGTTTYKQYSNAAGTGNGTASGTTTESCTKAVASLTAKANYYADGTTSCPACSSVGDGSYTLSVAGATMNTQCYKDCTTSTANIAHATAVSGNDYYGAGTDTCVATECDSGYAVSNGACQITSCTGATYMDSNLNTCVACPPGYDAHTTAGKTSVTECQIACSAGTYVENPGMIGYTRLEYLESSGTQYIDTGFTHKSSNIRGEILVGTTNEITANVNILGNQAGSGTSKTGYSIGWTPSLFKLWVNKVGNRLNGPTHALTAGTTHYIEYRLTDTQRWLTYDGQTVTDFHTGGIVTNKPIHLFDNGDHQMNQNFKGRIYFIRIYEDDVLVHNFVPASRDTDGAPGVYDAVTNQFFENSNTGTFTYDDNINMGCVNVGYGHYAGASTTNYGDVGTRTACPLGTYSNIDNGTSAAVCIACTGATYADETGSRTCKNCPSGFTYNTSSGKISATQCQINCAAGKYVPISYERLDYIESTGTQYIPTEINVSTLVNPVMTLDVQYTATENNKQTGAGTGTSAANQFVVGMASSQFQCSLANGKNVAAWDTNRHTFVADAANGTCSVDNTTVNVTPGNLSAINKPIYIGGVGGVDARVAKAKYYGFKLESNGTLIMDLVPARRVSDNTIGMYDMISGNFLGGYGGVFGVGSVLNSSICTDVDTGYYAAGGPVNYGSTLAQTACSNKPEHSEYTGGASTNACPFACDTGLVFNNGACVDECNGVMYGGECHERCSVGSGLFNAGEYSYPLFADRGGISSPVMGVKYPNGSVCYLYFEADAGEEHGFKTLYNNSTYHAIDPR